MTCSGLPEQASRWTEDEQERAALVLGGQATVVNVRKNGPHRRLVPWLSEAGLLIYIGHAGARHAWPESDFASPFVAEARTDRALAVRLYEEWLDQQPGLLRRLGLGELRGRALGCWCAPNQCHGDVLAGRHRGPLISIR